MASVHIIITKQQFGNARTTLQSSKQMGEVAK